MYKLVRLFSNLVQDTKMSAHKITPLQWLKSQFIANFDSNTYQPLDTRQLQWGGHRSACWKRPWGWGRCPLGQCTTRYQSWSSSEDEPIQDMEVHHH